jgi:hypothetical protein
MAAAQVKRRRRTVNRVGSGMVEALQLADDVAVG